MIARPGYVRAVRFTTIERSPASFVRPMDAGVLARLCERAFPAAEVTAITELRWGSYNNAYRVEFAKDEPVVLRVAPEQERQFRVEHGMMRNEYAAAPYFAVVADLLPRIVFADFTRQLVDRDYLFETVVPGTPLPDVVGGRAGREHAPLFEQMGDVARRIHTVSGPGFGPVAGPWCDTWSEALVRYFRVAADDVRDAGYDATDIRALADETERLAAVVDEITEPRLLHGDGWTGNFLVGGDMTVSGVVDWDRAEWGDPLSDWAIQRALQRPDSVRQAFWTGYGRPRTVATGVRQDIYHAKFLLGLRLDMSRPGLGASRSEDIAANRAEFAQTLARVRGATVERSS